MAAAAGVRGGLLPLLSAWRGCWRARSCRRARRCGCARSRSSGWRASVRSGCGGASSVCVVAWPDEMPCHGPQPLRRRALHSPATVSACDPHGAPIPSTNAHAVATVTRCLLPSMDHWLHIDRATACTMQVRHDPAASVTRGISAAPARHSARRRAGATAQRLRAPERLDDEEVSRPFPRLPAAAASNSRRRLSVALRPPGLTYTCLHAFSFGMDRPQTPTGRGAAQDCGDATTRAAWRRSGQGVCVRDPLSTAKRLQISTPLARAARLALQLVHLVSGAVHSAHPAQAENKHTARPISSVLPTRGQNRRDRRVAGVVVALIGALLLFGTATTRSWRWRGG
eukprot:COSAG01_NODE_48_length_31904_cov_21.696997_41_plen_341_part_00